MDAGGIGRDLEPATSTVPVRDEPRHDAFARAGKALDDAAVRWCRLRDRGRAAGGDDDLLVAAADMDIAKQALADAGFHERRQPGRGTHRAFYGYDEATGTWAKLDIVTAIRLGRGQEWPTPLAEGCLARRVIRPEDPRPSPDDRFWTLLLHELVDRPFVALRHADVLRELSADARTDSEGATFFREIAGKGWPPERAISVIADAHASDLVELAGRLRAGLSARSPLARLDRLRSGLIRRLDRMDPPFVRRGLTVALLGPDGAGKSTLAATVAAGGPMTSRRVYLGLYGGGRRTGGGGGRASGRRGLRGIGTLRRLVAMWRGWLVGWWHVQRGRLVTFDRHPYDARLGARARGLARLRRWILGRSLPAPDVVVILDAPSALLVSRKSEHPVERIEEQRRGYLALAATIPGAVVVDVSGPLELVARRVTAVIAGALAARSRGR